MQDRTAEAILAERRLAVAALERTPEGESRSALEELIEALDDEYRLALQIRQAQDGRTGRRRRA